MGTRSTYRIIEQWQDTEKKEIKGREICLIYVQYDGYPEGHPSEVAEWLSGSRVVNGLGADSKENLVFNGAGCLAAQLIAKLKDGAGNVYMHTLSSRGNCCEDYLYDIIVTGHKDIEFVCYSNYGDEPNEIFRGTPQRFAQTYKGVEA